MNLFKEKFLRVPHLSVFESILETSRNPFVDWIWILIISIVLAIVLIINSMSLYQRVGSGNIQSKSTLNNTPAATFNQADLQTVIGKFDLKQANQNDAKRGYSGPANPAI